MVEYVSKQNPGRFQDLRFFACLELFSASFTVSYVARSRAHSLGPLSMV